VVQRRKHLRFVLESRNTFGIVAESFRKKLDGDTTAQLGIGGLIHVAHSADPRWLVIS
jgi:predicted xylose isomerase-like sugar epimerase